MAASDELRALLGARYRWTRELIAAAALGWLIAAAMGLLAFAAWDDHRHAQPLAVLADRGAQ